MCVCVSAFSTQAYADKYIQTHTHISCLNFWDEACWFLSLSFFGLLSSSLLLFPKEQDNKLPFLDLLVTRTEQGFRSSVYRKPTFNGQYLNFNSHHPYTVKKGIVRCLQHRAKTISSDTDAYQEEMIILRHNLHRNNYPESITSAPRNLDRRMEGNTRKLTTVCLPYVKGLAERIKNICSPYDIRTIFTSGSTLRRYLFRVKP